MQQIYRRTPMLKCDFNKVAKQLYWNTLWHRCSSVNLLDIFKTLFPKNTSGGLIRDFSYKVLFKEPSSQYTFFCQAQKKWSTLVKKLEVGFFIWKEWCQRKKNKYFNRINCSHLIPNYYCSFFTVLIVNTDTAGRRYDSSLKLKHFLENLSLSNFEQTFLAMFAKLLKAP